MWTLLKNATAHIMTQKVIYNGTKPTEHNKSAHDV